MLPAVCQANRAGHRVVLPSANLAEAALVRGVEVAATAHLLEVCAHVNGTTPLAFGNVAASAPVDVGYPDLSDVRGQSHAKRALEIAAAGAHSLLMIGPPGSGKSMLAHRLPGILPPMTEEEALETATVASISTQGFRLQDWARRPFRAPHHTASGIALVGGGSHPRPGEISLAHHGVLFLDELPEFPRHVLEVLREPLETGTITISRAARQADFPARFQFVAAMNPCPCGYLGDPDGRCHCGSAQVDNYRARVSGPLLDRIDLHVEVSRADSTRLQLNAAVESSVSVAARVARARAVQMERGNSPNAYLSNREIERVCRVERCAASMLARALDQLGLSARAYHRILKVARTVADLDGCASISALHVAEAIQFKRFQAIQRVA